MLNLPLPNGKAKIPGRGISFDFNPGEVSYVVSELDKQGRQKIIAAGRITFSEDIKHINKPSWSSESKYQTNCLHIDISYVIKELFNIAVHYQCAESIREDLEFKIKIYDKFNPKESNYKNKHKWCRELIESLVHRRCAETGILDIIVNPAYSSFEGGIQNRQFCDSVAAAAEIGRRGLNRYKNGSFYPQVTQKDVSTLLDVFKDTPDVELRVQKDKFIQILENINTSVSWAEIYKSIKGCFRNKADFEHRYRTNYKEAA